MLPVGRAVKALAFALALVGCAGDPVCPLAPGLDAAQCATLAAMRGADAPPPSPTNARADDLATATLGFLWFFDASFSRDHDLHCASCHAVERKFGDGVPVAIGLATGTRNTPSVLDAARRDHGFFWDGRADVLWAPPILALENPLEMGSTRLALAHRLADRYADRYAAIFGPLPDLADTVRFPDIGKPGDPAWDAMAPADQDAINRVAANFGKALEAYMRKLATGPSPFDRFLDGDATALTDAQRHGVEVFVSAGCATCHGGPLLSDGGYHDLGVPAWDGVADDPGRAAGIALERAQIFAPDGPYADAPVTIAIAAPTPEDAGALRTPSLRNVSLTGPYMHNGRFATLAEAIEFHAPAPLTADDTAALVELMAAFDGRYPGAPWRTWPDTP
ncbi:MAG: cytochrome-c peroxidase [Deltaproteobacteria bacterium]|nr:cytochrome-c peroxidase [Deltaproteobacteria bacterium]